MSKVFGSSNSNQNTDSDTRRDGDQASDRVTTYSVVNRRGDVRADPPRR